MAHYSDILVSPELLDPLWKDIDTLESRGCYKEAYQYLRTVTDELNLLREARISVCCLLESGTEAWSSFQTLQALMSQHLAPVKEHSKLMFLESLRAIMQAAHQALLCKVSVHELQALVITLCSAHCDRLDGDSGLSELHWILQPSAYTHSSNLH